MVIKAEKKRADRLLAAVLVPAETCHHAVTIAVMFHLQHRALSRLVGTGRRLCHDAVKAGPLEAIEPVKRLPLIGRRGRQVERRRGTREERDQPLASLREGQRAQVLSLRSENIKCNERGRRRDGEHPDAAGGGMQAKLQRLEVEAVRRHDDNLAVHHRAYAKLRNERIDQLGEVTSEILSLTALDERAGPIAKDDRAEAVPFRLEDPAPTRGKLRNQLRKHRRDRRLQDVRLRPGASLAWADRSVSQSIGRPPVTGISAPVM